MVPKQRICEISPFFEKACNSRFKEGLSGEIRLPEMSPSAFDNFLGWLYNNILYPTTQEFRAAVFSPGFEVLPVNIEGGSPFYDTSQKGPVLPLDDQAPPMPIGGKVPRFSVDYKQNYVEWMGFSFYISQSEDMGMGLHDIRFKGERIIYEIRLQEALAHYAAINPTNANTAYLDSAFGFGSGAVELMPGYDCPTYATYLNTSLPNYESANSLCLFEFEADYPMQRSYYYSNTKNIFFSVRSVYNVGNYDYQMTYEFYMDGSIQIIVRAAGYIFPAYYGNNHDYGFRIRDTLSGSMHDHVLQFKVDFDILGTNNTMQLMTVEATTEQYAWADHPRNTFKLNRHELETEDESQLFWSPNGATQYIIYNKEETNQFGEYRGYRIMPSQNTVHLTTQNSSTLANAANFAKYDIAVSQYKDGEQRSVHPLNDQDIYEPMVDFDAFFDGDSLQQQDLVTWVNLGLHHVPHTGAYTNSRRSPNSI